jgi:CheY-like chemotaxis protein
MPDTALTLPAPLNWVPPTALAVRARTLLLVEDSRQAAEAVRLLARRLGLRLRRAEHLAAARLHLHVYRPDVALIDLGLPDGSGLDLIAELASMRPPLRRIVAISADHDAGAEALAAGACAFVAKPLRLPADLPALLGPDTPSVPPGSMHGPQAGRNGGADPMALRDDLVHARTVLMDRGTDGLDYAASFVQGLARCTGDPALQGLARDARLSGDASCLLDVLSERAAAETRHRPI